ncbi:MAG: hydroxyectoine utilization dehydratase EutB [Minwuia sp.]|uniref:hydroxyectoine utilization dehydratase EutB n=1 Tax=Minwuia sp. TaxID=2493630 RepID=UPI003A88CD80
MPNLNLSDIFAARQRVVGVVQTTPLVPSALSGPGKAPISLKLECMQPTGAFKLRGAANTVAVHQSEGRTAGFVSVSTGNHGRAVAYAAERARLNATICLSELVPDVKVKAIEALGAEVVRAGRSQDEAQLEADRLVREKGLIEIPPFDDRHVIAGQGTVGLELLEQAPDLDCIVIPLSGGGLAAGVALAAKAIKPSIRLVGISMDRGAAMQASLTAGKPVEVEELPSLADSLGGGIGLSNRFTFALCRDLLDEVILVSEQEIYDGMRALYREDRIVAEGASAVGHAALLVGKLELDGPTAFLITGRNVDMGQFSAVIAGETVRLGNLEVRGGGHA